MKVIVPQPVLAQALELVQGVVDTRGTMPLLSNTLLKTVAGDRFQLSATDLDVFVKAEFEGAVEERGDVCFPAKDVYTIVKQFDGENLTLSATRDRLTVTQGRKKYEFNTVPAEDYPSSPAVGETKFSDLAADQFAGQIRRTFFAAAIDDPRVYLNGVHMESRDGGFRLVATDGHRLAVSDGPAKVTMAKPVIVPRKALTEVLKILDRAGTDSVDIGFGATMGFLRYGGTQLAFRLIEGTFPNYEQVIPGRTERFLKADRASVLKALKRIAGLASRDYGSAVVFRMGPDGLSITIRNPEIGIGQEDVEAEYFGDPDSVAFNAKYLIELLAILDSGRVTFGFNDRVAPSLLTTGLDDGFRCVVMPMDLGPDGG